MSTIYFSLGSDKFDNCPAQRSANDFSAFADVVDNARSEVKGQTYICAPLGKQPHRSNADKYPGVKHWRQKGNTLPRRFLALDLDGFATPSDLQRLCELAESWSCIIYTTFSHKEDAPRARVLIELDRAIDELESEALGKAVQRSIENKLGVGTISFDQSVYKGSQPVYTPPVEAQVFRYLGSAIDVDTMLISFTTLHEGLPIHGPSDLVFALSGLNNSLPSGDVPEGSRNNEMLRVVGRLRKHGLSEARVLEIAHATNSSKFKPPLPAEEVDDICSRYRCQGSGKDEDVNQNQPIESEGRFRIPDQPPPKREYVFAGQVTSGTLNVIGGQGGVSKTMLAMQICVAAATGQAIGGMRVMEGASILILGEEDVTERDRRFGAICAYTGADIQLVEARVRCLAAAGQDIRLTEQVNSNPQGTPFGKRLVAFAQHHARVTRVPVRIIVIDHARLVLGGDPNDAEDVTQLTRVLTGIARDTGAAVVLLAHSPKSVSNKSGDEISAADIAGSSAFVDNARSAFMMWTMRKDEAKAHHISESERQTYVRLENVKANYSHTGGGYWFKRAFMPEWEVAVLTPAKLFSAALFEAKATSDLRDRILDQARKKCGGLTARHLRDISGVGGVLKASDGVVRREVEAMLEDGLLDRREPTPEERKKFRLAGAVREVLVPMSE